MMAIKAKYYYGYNVVAASTIILILGFGTFYSYSVFFNSLSTQFGWDSIVTSGAFSVATIVSGFLGIIAGRISDRFGPKVICIFGGVFVGAGYILMSMVQSPWQVYVLYGLLLAAGVGGLWPAALSTVARWFGEKRGLMTGIVTAGVGVGSVIFAPLISHFISDYSWRTAYIIIGAITFVGIILAALFLKREPDQTSPATNNPKIARKTLLPGSKNLTFSQVIRTRQFWMILGVYFLFGYSQFSVVVHIVPYASGQGISSIAGASVLSVIGASSIFGRLITGGINDKVRVKPLFVSIVALLLVSLVWLEFSGKLWALYVFGLVFGLAYGGASALQSLVTAELFGLASLGILVGVIGFSICTGGALGPVITGFIFDLSGSYQLAFLICAFAALVALVLLSFLRPSKKQV